MIDDGIGLAGRVLATVALALTQATESRWPDAIATGLIVIALVAAAVALMQQNRSLLTGRGVPARVLEAMRNAIAAQTGVVDVPQLLAVVRGPAMLAVEGDVAFDDALTVPEVEATVSKMKTELRSHWPDVRCVYLTRSRLTAVTTGARERRRVPLRFRLERLPRHHLLHARRKE